MSCPHQCRRSVCRKADKPSMRTSTDTVKNTQIVNTTYTTIPPYKLPRVNVLEKTVAEPDEIKVSFTRRAAQRAGVPGASARTCYPPGWPCSPPS